MKMNYFKKQLGYIKNEDIRNHTIKVLENVQQGFFEDAASSTGKYHPAYALGYGGLYRHTKAAVNIAYDLLQLEQNKQLFNEYDDYIIAALILHDCCKHGYEWESTYTVHEHPSLATRLLYATLNEDETAASYIHIVGTLIVSHMGQWNVNARSTIVLPKPLSASQQFVHMCDYLASRKYLEYKFTEEDLSDE